MEETTNFNDAMYGVGERIRRVLVFLPDSVKRAAEEIRIRAGLPVTLTVSGETVFVLKDGQTSLFISANMLLADSKDVAESFRLLCRNSVYAHAEELKHGYISMKSGHRAGICGTLSEKGIMHDVSSVNIRIAHEIIGAADSISECWDGGGILIAGPPGSGKTTVLRDLIRQLSDGTHSRPRRIAVIDSRRELSGGKGENTLGRNTDVLLTRDKAVGIEMAVRTLYPHAVAFDEIGTAAELDGVRSCFNAGVEIITTAHIGCERDLMLRSVTSELLQSGAIGTVALLPEKHSGKIRFIDMKEHCGGAFI